MALTEIIPTPIISQPEARAETSHGHPILATAAAATLILSGLGYSVESGLADSTLNAIIPHPPVHEMVTPQELLKPNQKYIVLKQRNPDAPMVTRPFSTSVKDLTAATRWLRHHV
jgi:hypothetical protein